MYLRTYLSASVSVNLCFSTCVRLGREGRGEGGIEGGGQLVAVLSMEHTSSPVHVYLYSGANGKVLWLIEGWLVGRTVWFGYFHSFQELAS